MREDLISVIKRSVIVMQCMGGIPFSFKSYAMDSQTLDCKTVLYGYSPGPKSSIFMPVCTSNSVLAVPAPKHGTDK